MNLLASRSARLAAILASVSLVSTPALAASLPAPSAPQAVAAPVAGWSPSADVMHDRGWGRHRHDDDGIDGGDILAGILLIGGIAAIASAVSNSSKRKQAVQPQYDTPQPAPQQQAPAYREPSPKQTWDESAKMSRLDDAADACVDAVSHHAEVDHVYTVDPSGSGYRVAGDFTSGESFSCAVNGDRVENVHYGNGGVSWEREGARYRNVPQPWAGDGQASSAAPSGQDSSTGDGRYDAASSPDFGPAPVS